MLVITISNYFIFSAVLISSPKFTPVRNFLAKTVFSSRWVSSLQYFLQLVVVKCNICHFVGRAQDIIYSYTWLWSRSLFLFTRLRTSSFAMWVVFGILNILRYIHISISAPDCRLGQTKHFNNLQLSSRSRC